MEVLLAIKSKEAQDRAEASFKRKQERDRDGAKAMAEYEATGVALRKKTAGLKALRLAKEAADLESQAKAKLVTAENQPVQSSRPRRSTVARAASRARIATQR
jgi:hypothetical protein